jgi:hypothetical protein
LVEDLTLTWSWPGDALEGDQRFVLTIRDENGGAVLTSTVVTTSYTLRPSEEALEPGGYSWTVRLEREVEGQWEEKATAAWNELRLEAPIPVPTREATRESSQSMALRLVAPAEGNTQTGGTVTFEWEGRLGAGQDYRVTARHPKSGTTLESGPLTDTRWTVDLPGERVGEWCWTVDVYQGDAVVTSSKGMFWFDPTHSENGRPGRQ